MEQHFSDELLMRRFCESLDEEVFRVLASRYYESALRVAEDRLGDYAWAQDAVQETLLRIVRFRDRYDPAKPFTHWFYAVLRNACTDIYRKESRRQEALKALADSTPDHQPDDASKERVLELTAALPGPDTHLLRLRFVEGLSIGEIGGQLGCSLDAAKKRLQRLLRKLKG